MSQNFIVDDDKEIRNLISVYLENEGLKTQKGRRCYTSFTTVRRKGI